MALNFEIWLLLERNPAACEAPQMSYVVPEFSEFLLPVDVDANAIILMLTLKVMTCCWVIPGSLLTGHSLRGDREGPGGSG